MKPTTSESSAQTAQECIADAVYQMTAKATERQARVIFAFVNSLTKK